MKTITANIHNIKDGISQELTLEDSRQAPVVYYNVDGLPQVVSSEITALAKKEVHPSGNVYYLRSGPDGLYNPISLYSMGSSHLSASKNGSLVWRYHKVSEECFNLYLKFLQTKNQSHYIQCSRLVKASII